MARPIAPNSTPSYRNANVQKQQLPIRKTGGIRVLQQPSGLSGRQSHESGQHSTHPPASSQPLYRRLFYPSPTDVPPRILATPGTEQLDIQLYTLLALICRGFISPWFSKISRDRAFFLEVVRIASYVFRQIEAKLVGSELREVEEGDRRQQGVDKIRLLCVGFPRVLERHVQDYWKAKETAKSAYAAGAYAPSSTSSISPFEAYFHSLQPHAAISSSSVFSATGDPSQEKLPPYINADYVRAMIDALLREFLPPEDYRAETERSVVREVILGIILGGVLNKVSQPWFIYGLIAKTLEQKQLRKNTSSAPLDKLDETPQPLFTKASLFVANLPLLFYRITALFASLSLLITTSLATSYPTGSNTKDLARAPVDLGFTFVKAGADGRQVLDQLKWAALTSTSIFAPLLDRVIIHFLHTYIFTASFMSTLLAVVETALFPGGYPAPSVPDPTPEEQILIKERAYLAVLNAIPHSLLPYLLPGVPPQQAAEQLANDLLDPFDNQFCNNHLFLFILDLVVGNLCPELVVREG